MVVSKPRPRARPGVHLGIAMVFLLAGIYVFQMDYSYLAFDDAGLSVGYRRGAAGRARGTGAASSAEQQQDGGVDPPGARDPPEGLLEPAAEPDDGLELAVGGEGLDGQEAAWEEPRVEPLDGEGGGQAQAAPPLQEAAVGWEATDAPPEQQAVDPEAPGEVQLERGGEPPAASEPATEVEDRPEEEQQAAAEGSVSAEEGEEQAAAAGQEQGSEQGADDVGSDHEQQQQQQDGGEVEPQPAAAPAAAAAYLSLCLSVRDEHLDIEEWVAYHLELGVGRIYVYDVGSSPPMSETLAPYIATGQVQYQHVLGNLSSPNFYPRYQQLMVYELCIKNATDAGHRYMAFLDADEFIVLQEGTDDLLALLRQYEGYAGLALNWVMFGSAGHAARPEGGVLANYARCLPGNRSEHLHVKSIVDPRRVVKPGTPHHFEYEEGAYAVNTASEHVDGPLSDRVVWDKAVVHHYATRSAEDFKRKTARGTGMGNHKGKEFWDQIDGAATETCPRAVDLGRAVMGRLRSGAAKR